MKANRGFRFLAALFALCVFSLFFVVSATAEPAKADRESVLKAYGRLPLYFIENKGQLDPRVKFYVKTPGQTLYFTEEGIVFDLFRGGGDAEETGMKQERLVFSLEFDRARKEIPIQGLDRQTARINVFTGGRSAWRTDVPAYRGVVYRGIYEGIDLKAFGNGADVEYEFIVRPGGDPGKILLTYRGIEGLAVSEEGSLLIATAFGGLQETRPCIYQEMGERRAVDGGFEIRVPAGASRSGAFSYGFKIASYDRSHPLVIDPILSYSTYLGGSGYDNGDAIAVDASGNAYVTGYTSSSDFPTHIPYQGIRVGSADVFVTKVSSSGTALVYSTYLGGGGDDHGQGIAVDASGNAYVTGETYSSNFPTQNACQATHGGHSDAFAAKISSTGTALMYSTYLGGSGYDSGYGIAIDSSGNAYVAGETNSSNFPTQAPYQDARAAHKDAFVTKISSLGNSLSYSTYLGGGGDDSAHGIAVDASGNAYVVGTTESSNFPTQNPCQGTIAGDFDVFATKVSSSGSALVYSTYLGGSDYDCGNGIAVDSIGNAFLTGETASGNFPTQNAYQATYRDFSDAFAAKLSSTGTTLLYSTYLGGRGSDYGVGIAVDASGNAYVTGETFSIDFPTQNAYQDARASSTCLDAFVTRVSPSGSVLAYSTYLGGTGCDKGNGIAVDSSGNAYVTGYTNSSDFPTQNAYRATLVGSQDAFVSKFSSSAYSYYIPYYKANTVNCYTSLALRNSSSSSAATATVAAYRSDGTVVPLAAEFANFAIDPSGQWARVLPQIDVEGWVLVTSTQPLTGLAWVGTLDGAWPCLMADVSLIGELNFTLVVPHVAQTVAGWNPNGGWSTKVNICNPHATATNVTLTYYAITGEAMYTTTLSIPANGSVSYNLASLLPTDQSVGSGSVVITATQTAAAFALYYDVDKVPGADGTCFAGISAVKPGEGAAGSYSYCIPYYKAEDPASAVDGFYTSLALRNSSTVAATTTTVAAFKSDGTAVPLAAEFASFAIDRSGQWARVLPQIDVEGWVLVTSTQPLTGLAWVGTLDGAWPRLMADVSLIGELNSVLVVPHVAQTVAGWNPNGGWSTKVNICNPHATATNVALAYYTAAGATPYSTTLSIPANGSVSYNLASLLPTDQSFENGSLVITATQTVAAFALYYDVDKVPGADGTCFAGISAATLNPFAYQTNWDLVGQFDLDGAFTAAADAVVIIEGNTFSSTFITKQVGGLTEPHFFNIHGTVNENKLTFTNQTSTHSVGTTVETLTLSGEIEINGDTLTGSGTVDSVVEGDPTVYHGTYSVTGTRK